MSDSPPTAGISLLDLPNELLLQVKRRIPHADLRTHVCYYNICPRIAAFYGDKDEQESFWEHACRLAGLGLIKDEHTESVSWTEIAFDCIARDGFCKHPQCGGVLLERNAHQMAMARTYDEEEGVPEPNPVFAWVEFYKFHALSLEDDGYLRPDSEDIRHAMVSALRLTNHPIACRSFATFPRLEEMVICTITGRETENPKRKSGVTVWDVQALMHSLLDDELSMRNVATYLVATVPDRAIMGRGWDLSRVFDEMETLRGVFKMIRWEGLKWDEYYEFHRYEAVWGVESRDFPSQA